MKFVLKVPVTVSVIFVLLARVSYQACPGTSSISVGLGNFSSPGYPSNYPNNTQCIWNLTAAAGHKIKLSFWAFSLARYNYYCVYDAVEVYDGQSTYDRLLGKYCRNKPAPMFSSGRYMYVRFVSDATDVDSGFQAQYESVPDDQGCPNSGNINSTSGVISSPSYPSSYPGNSKCVWKISAPAGYVIKLVFTRIDLGYCSPCTQCDYVELSNSQNFDTDVIWRRCGSKASYQIFSTGQEFWVKFVSDMSIESWREGFHASYTMIPKDKQCGNSGVNLTGSGSISSVNYPSGYPSNTRCTWHITAPIGHVVKFIFERFHVLSSQCSDYVELSNTGDFVHETFKKYCDSSFTHNAIYSNGRNLWVRFVSGVSDDKYNGWTAVYFPARKNAICPGSGNITATKGVLQSVDYPKRYPDNTNCIWRITAPVGHVIKIQFEAFDIAPSSSCTADYLEIRDGLDSNGKQLLKACGSSTDDLYSSGRYLWIKFSSDFSSNRIGFRAVYSTAVQNQVCPGSGNITATKGVLQSVDYPKRYPDNTNCIWRITAPVGHVIKIQFEAFDIAPSSSCTADYLEVRDGLDSNGKQLLKACGSGPNNLYSLGRYLWIKFSSDFSSNRIGFRAVYSTAVQNQVCPGSGNITATKGVLQSVDYPKRYPDNTNCIWRITAPVGHVIKIQFEAFDIAHSSSCTADYLEVRDGLDFNGKTLFKSCGSSRYNLYSSGRYLWIKFSSDFSSAGKGFRAVYSTAVQNQVCPGSGVLNASTGTLQTVNYPSYYPINTRCIWKLIAPVGQKILFTILDLVISSCSGCACASLEVYDGQDSNSTRLARYCGRPYSHFAMFSTSRYMFLKFSGVNYNDASRGFKANYSMVPENGGCFNSGEINGTSGTIKTSYYPDWRHEYAGNTRCAWKIRVPDGLSVRLEFDYLSLSGCPGCNCSYLKIYDGSSESAPKIIETCSNSDKLFYSSGQFMYVVFRSDAQSLSYLKYGGFTASFQALPVSRGCPAQGVITGTSGYITSPKLPYRYSNKYNALCQWRIIAPPRHRLIFTFHDFDLKSDYYCEKEYVMLKESDDAGAVSGSIMYRRCGRRYTPWTVAASGRSAYLFYFRDSSRIPSYQRFNVTYYALNQDTPDCPMNGRINATSGVIQSPGYPSPYPSYSECTWVIAVPSGYRVRLQLRTACRDSWLYVWDGNSTSDRYITDYCTDQQNNVYSSTTSYMRLNLKCRSTTQKCAALRAAFTADKVSTCPAITRSNNLTGVITSPGYPSNYSEAANCSWTVPRPGSNYKIVFKFSFFRLESLCRNTFLSFRRQKNSLVPTPTPFYDTINIFCGSRSRNFEFTENYDVIVNFYSNSVGKYQGFNLTYTVVEKSVATLPPSTPSSLPPPLPTSSAQPRCPQSVQYLATSNGSIQSLYQQGYPNDMTCTWLIKNPTPHSIALRFSFLDLEANLDCTFDYVEVRDGNSRNSPLLGKFCGSVVPALLVSSTRYLWIRFRTDSSTSRKGFIAFFVSKRPPVTTDSIPWTRWSTTTVPTEVGTEDVEISGPKAAKSAIIVGSIIGVVSFIILLIAVVACWCYVKRLRSAAGNAGNVVDHRHQSAAQTDQAFKSSSLTGPTENDPGYAPGPQAYDNTGLVAAVPDNRYEMAPMVELGPPPPYAPYSQPHSGV